MMTTDDNNDRQKLLVCNRDNNTVVNELKIVKLKQRRGSYICIK